jgi:hypothetical protein
MSFDSDLASIQEKFFDASTSVAKNLIILCMKYSILAFNPLRTEVCFCHQNQNA